MASPDSALHQKPLTPCPDCSVPVSDVEEHRGSVHGREPLWECESCGFLFWSQERLAKHVESVHAIRHPSCDICNSSFGSKGDLNAHLRAKHRDSQMLFCPTCSIPLLGLASVVEHMKAEHSDKWLVCDVCTENAEPGARVVYYGSQQDLDAHVLVKHVEKSLFCQECGLVSESKEKNRWHRSRAHPTAYPVRCEVCGMRFRGVKGLKLHLKRSPGCAVKRTPGCAVKRTPGCAVKRTRSFDVDLEGQVVSDKGDPFSDDEMVESPLKSRKSGVVYSCPECPRTFGTRRAAARHNEAVHAVKRCRYCGDVFGTESWKKSHERQCKVKMLIGCPFHFPEYVAPRTRTGS